MEKKKFVTYDELHNGEYLFPKKDLDGDSFLRLNKQFCKNENDNRETLLKIEFSNFSKVAGSGFGNLDVSDSIRTGYNSRYDNRLFRDNLEGKQMFDHKFQYLDDAKTGQSAADMFLYNFGHPHIIAAKKSDQPQANKILDNSTIFGIGTRKK